MDWNFDNNGPMISNAAHPAMNAQPVYLVPAPERESVEEPDGGDPVPDEGTNTNHYLSIERYDNGIVLNMSCHNSVKGHGHRRVMCVDNENAMLELETFMSDVFASFE